MCVCVCVCVCVRAGLTLVFVLGARLVLLHVEGGLRLHPLLGVQEAFLHETQSVQRLVSGGRRLLREFARKLVLRHRSVEKIIFVL